jgi:hypothetical protein
VTSRIASLRGVGRNNLTRPKLHDLEIEASCLTLELTRRVAAAQEQLLIGRSRARPRAPAVNASNATAVTNPYARCGSISAIQSAVPHSRGSVGAMPTGPERCSWPSPAGQPQLRRAGAVRSPRMAARLHMPCQCPNQPRSRARLRTRSFDFQHAAHAPAAVQATLTMAEAAQDRHRAPQQRSRPPALALHWLVVRGSSYPDTSRD